MKKMFAILAFSVFVCMSCKKDTPIEASSLTIASDNSNYVYVPGQKITITWESTNLPSGSMVLAEIRNHSGANGSIGFILEPIQSQKILLYGNLTSITQNDGQEDFWLPQDASDLYQHDGFDFGTSFNIRLIAVWPDGGAWKTYSDSVKPIEAELPSYFTIFRVGCGSTLGYSSVTGLPCMVH